MKTMKKVLALVLALVLAMSLCTVAFADGEATTYTVSVKSGDTHSYAVYQIFTGDYYNEVLSNVKYGTNAALPSGKSVGDAVDQTVLDAILALTGTDAEKAAELAKYVDFSGTNIPTVSAGNSKTFAPGYYLIKDLGTVADGADYSLYMVEIVGDTEIDPKVGTTTSEKKVKDVNDSDADSLTGWQDSADYDIGDDVPFQLKAVVASDYANYLNGYKLPFHDIESDGLTFNNDVKVYVDGDQITTGYTVVTNPTDNDTFDVVFANLKNISAVNAGSVITVEYTSKLNTGAAIGAAGNPNTMHITYTNNPNDVQAGENGETPDDTVIVFTYKVVVNKTDGEKPLPGATFELFKKVGNDWVTKGTCEATAVKGKDGETVLSYTASWTGLDDGDYKLVETVTPNGYNTIADQEFSVVASHVVDSSSPTLESLTGSVTTGDIEFAADDANSTLSTEVVNQSGSTLPETGGIGTTIFYVLGATLLAAAAVLLITKKRMSVEG